MVIASPLAQASEKTQAVAAFNSRLQAILQSGMGALGNVPPGWSGIVRIWVDETGLVTRVSLGKANGPPIDVTALQKALERTRLPAPPPGIPMPIVTRISVGGGKLAPPALAAYFREVEQKITASLRALPDMPIMIDGTARLWIDPGGQVTKAELVALKGLTINEAEVRQVLLRLHLPAPPPGMPMPVSTQVRMEPVK